MVSKNFNPGPSHHFYFIRRGLYNAISKHSPNLKGVMLDFGCGSKPYKSLINVDKYIGLDFDNPGHDHSNEEIDVFYDGKNIPFGNDHFDSILCSEVFEHLFDLEGTLKEMHRVLKKGGRMLVTCPFVWNEHELPYDYARYTKFALTSLFDKHGFKVVTFDKQGNYIEAVTQLRALYCFNAYGSFFSRLSYPGTFMLRSMIATVNVIGKIKSSLLPKRDDLYLSNVFVVEKL